MSAARRPVTRNGLVARPEWPALLAAAAAYFCLLSGYYMLRSLREAMALEAGREWIPALFTTVLLVQLAILPLYWWIVARTMRRRLLLTVYLPVVALFLALALGLARTGTSEWLAAGYFVAITSVNLFIVSVFWSVMADRWSPDASERLFGFIAGGGSLGALAGPLLVTLVAGRIGAAAIIAIACTLLTLAVACGYLAQTLNRGTVESGAAPSMRAPVGGRALDDLARLVRSPYLLAIAGLIVAGQVVGAFMYNEQARYVEAAYTGLADRTALFARVDLAVNVLALAFQTLVVGWLTTRGSLKLSLSAMPALAGLSFVALALAPTLAMVLVTQVMRRGADYGLAKPTREMLYTVLNPESKFKSKSLIDTVLQRGADTLGNWLYVLIAGLGLAGLSVLSAAICFALIAATWWLGASFEKRQ
ncbi:MAG: Npt1/Npt2 family nucleotide transporter [Steroidobacteraceae bacterium]